MTEQTSQTEIIAPGADGVSREAVAPTTRTQPRALQWGALALDLLLVVLFWTGIYFRFTWRDWNEGTNLHPDEYGLTNTVTQLRLPGSLDEYFNTRLSPISPYNKYDENGNPTFNGPDNRMRWGQWPIILLKLGAEATGNTGYDEQRLLGRTMSAAADTLAVLIIFLIGARLYNRRVGLLAAALSSLAVLQIQQSHFMTADTFATLFAVAAMYCAVRVITPTRSLPHSRDGALTDSASEARMGEGLGRGWARVRWYVLFGVMFGMALASRINLAPLFGMILIAAGIAHADAFKSTSDYGPLLWRMALLVALAGVVGAVTFRLTQPMSFRAEEGDTTIFTLTPNQDWVDSMAVSQAESNLDAGGPPAEQWTARPKIIFPLVNMILWGLGLPLGLAAWAGLGWAAWRSLRTDEWRQHLLPVIWVGGFFLFMGTRWVMSVRYFLPLYPFLALMAAWALYEVWKVAGGWPLGAGRWPLAASPQPLATRLLAGLLFGVVVVGTLAWAWGFTNIYRASNSRLQASRWMYRNIPGPFNLIIQQADGSEYADPLPFPEGLPIGAEGPQLLEFKPQVSGTLSRLTLAHARNQFDVNTPGRLEVVLARDPGGAERLAEAQVIIGPSGGDARGASYEVAFNNVSLEKDKTYYLLLTAPEGGPILVSGATITNENWDEPLPPGGLEGRNPFGGLYQGLQMEMHWLDDENKRQMLLANLEQADYVLVQSQRRLWASTRIPSRYPMTMEYYRALFDGRLGFDLVAQFHNPIVIGPLQVSDLTGTWAWGRPPDVPARGPDYPFNYSLWAAEEAFSVYDHAPVWIFRKRADFDLAQVSRLLYAVDLSQVVDLSPKDATRVPNLMLLPKDLLAIQRVGGTWSAMFDADSLLNTSEPLAVSVWYLALLVMGALAFPLTFAAFSGLPDRGYPFAKTVALLCVTWFVWFLGSFRLLPYTRGSIFLGFAVLAAISGLIAWQKRLEIRDYLRARGRHILIVEAVGLALFLLMLFIRWGNPDLWHQWKGGEKPMDFSYFNAVLKSTYFPPYDPWLAGGYLNYYYYGFVVVGVPTKLLGIVPALAYNLILPMLFSLLGVNAFGVAYNLVASGQRSREAVSDQQSAISNPYLAGLAAALMMVVLGNLGQVRTFVVGFQGVADHAALAQSWLGDNWITATLDGVWRVATGKAQLAIGLDRWYWDASRLISNINGAGSDFAEFPFFSFLYADLHAHMIAMPFTVLAIGWAVAYLLGFSARRGRTEVLAFWLIGGLTIGLTRPTNTWDYPMYLALGVSAIIGAYLLEARWQLSTLRANSWSIAWQLAVLVGVSTLAYWPFDQWVAVPLTKLEFWKNERTSIEAYLYMYGLPLFLLITFVAIETRRWLAETPVTVLRRLNEWLTVLLLAVGVFIAGLALFLYLGVSVALIALPLLVWTGLLALRGRAAMPPEKRAVLFLLGTALAVTLFLDVYTLGGDRMNTVFKLSMQAWMLFIVAAGAALAWVWADQPRWNFHWRNGWVVALTLLVGGAALYTVTATNAKIKDRFVAMAVTDAGGGCQAIPGMPLPYVQGTPPAEQPRGLNGMSYLTWTAYCDQGYFLPLVYDYEAMRWLQDNVQGSPVIVESQTFDLYKMSSRYAWNTGLPNVVGWDWHQRQQRGAGPTGYISHRGAEVSLFYCLGSTLALEDIGRYKACGDVLVFAPDLGGLLQEPDAAETWADEFIRQYDVRYIIVGPQERAYYPPDGLAKFERMAAQGRLAVAYRNEGVTIYEVRTPVAGQ